MFVFQANLKQGIKLRFFGFANHRNRIRRAFSKAERKFLKDAAE